MVIAKNMHEFWLTEKLLLTIGLFQFGLILVVFTGFNLSKLIGRKRNITGETTGEVMGENIPNQITDIKSTVIAASNSHEIETSEITNQALSTENDAVNNPSNHEINLDEINLEPVLSDRPDSPVSNQPEIENDSKVDVTDNFDNFVNDPVYKVDIAPELLTEIKEISNNPAAVIDEAIRWWLRRRTFDVLDASDDRPDRVGIRSNNSKRSPKELWND